MANRRRLDRKGESFRKLCLIEYEGFKYGHIKSRWFKKQNKGAMYSKIKRKGFYQLGLH